MRAANRRGWRRVWQALAIPCGLPAVVRCSCLAGEAATGPNTRPEWWWTPLYGGAITPTGIYERFAEHGFQLNSTNAQPYPFAWPLRPLRADTAPTGRAGASEDGRFLVFPRYEVGAGGVWVRDLMTGRERQLAATRATPLNPVISTDGSWVAYTVTTTERGGNQGPGVGYVVQTTGGAPRRVCEDCQIYHGVATTGSSLSSKRPCFSIASTSQPARAFLLPPRLLRHPRAMKRSIDRCCRQANGGSCSTPGEGHSPRRCIPIAQRRRRSGSRCTHTLGRSVPQGSRPMVGSRPRSFAPVGFHRSWFCHRDGHVRSQPLRDYKQCLRRWRWANATPDPDFK